MRTNFHTHSTWCDGANTPAEMAAAAREKGFSTLGFSSHLAIPFDDGCAIATTAKARAYVADVRRVAAAHAGAMRVLCGAEADYVPGVAVPDRTRHAALGLDYLIGSVHYVKAPDGALVPVDHTPEKLRAGIAAHFGGDAEAYVRAYFAQERDMAAQFDFDVVGHPDLVRKFNAKHPLFDENAAWYREEVERTADALAASGKIVEVNTGAISRGWLDDAYPSPAFRAALRARGARFVLSSDAHAADALDCAFDRFGNAETYCAPAWAEGGEA